MNNKHQPYKLHYAFDALERRTKPRREFVRYLANRLELRHSPVRWPWLLPMLVTPLVVLSVIVVAWPKPQIVSGIDRQVLTQSLQQISFTDPTNITHYTFVTTTPGNNHLQEDIWYNQDNARVDRTSQYKNNTAKFYSKIYSKIDGLDCDYEHKVQCTDLTTSESKYIRTATRHNLFSQPNASLSFNVTINKLMTFPPGGTNNGFVITIRWVTPQPITVGTVLHHDDPTDRQSYFMSSWTSTDKTILNTYQDGTYHQLWKRSLTTKDNDIYLQVESDNSFSDIIKYDVMNQTTEVVDPYQIPLLQNEITQFSLEQDDLERYLLLPQFLANHFAEIPEGRLTITSSDYHGQAATAITIPDQAISAIDATDLFLNPDWSDINRSTKLWFSSDHALLGSTILEANGIVVSDTTIQREVLPDNPKTWFTVDNWKQAMTSQP